MPDTVPSFGAPRLELLKALGDNTRYAIYLELARSPMPLATAQIAESLHLHPNTVRPHLDRMREVGLLEVVTDAQGTVGRPQHRYSLAADAPSLGFDPESVVDEDGATIAFTRCPFRELAEANPDLVCSLHRGLVEGFVDGRGDGRVLEFHGLADRTPCQVEISTVAR